MKPPVLTIEGTLAFVDTSDWYNVSARCIVLGDLGGDLTHAGAEILHGVNMMITTADIEALREIVAELSGEDGWWKGDGQPFLDLAIKLRRGEQASLDEIRELLESVRVFMADQYGGT